jgi:hypothetical protein
MAATSLRLLWDHLGRALALIASSAHLDFPAWALETGDLHQWWQASITAAQSLGYDAGSGQTRSPNALVIPRADYLVSIGASVDVRWSDDGGPTGTSIGQGFPWTPITSGHLAGPTALHAVAEWTPVAKRGWYVHLYGSVSAPARLAGGWFFGTTTDLPTSPIYGREQGVERPHRGRDLIAGWPPMTRVNARVIKAALAAVTPNAADGGRETAAGVYRGGLPHWIWDPAGRTFSETDPQTPYLLPVFCVTPEAALSRSLTGTLESPPTEVRWREQR